MSSSGFKPVRIKTVKYQLDQFECEKWEWEQRALSSGMWWMNEWKSERVGTKQTEDCSLSLFSYYEDKNTFQASFCGIIQPSLLLCFDAVNSPLLNFILVTNMFFLLWVSSVWWNLLKEKRFPPRRLQTGSDCWCNLILPVC